MQKLWYGRSAARWLLQPLSLLFGGLVRARRAMYRRGLLDSQRVSAPVVVVGNITVGGTGKTPLVIWLASQLASRGWRPGVVLRGYGGRAHDWPRVVTADADPALVGDEAVLLSHSTGALVVAGPDRVAAAERAVTLGADLVLADDGLQHYRLARDCELIVVDAHRMLGNGALLPAGPLREPAARLATVDLVLLNRREGSAAPALSADRLVAGWPESCVPVSFTTRVGRARSLTSGNERELESFRSGRVHALAGIGHPEAFFAALEARGLTIVRHAPGDHAALTAEDIAFADHAPVLMTEKDAVKCRAFADERCWVVATRIEFEHGGAERLLGVVERAARRRLAPAALPEET